jgi:hypothetical protein
MAGGPQSGIAEAMPRPGREAAHQAHQASKGKEGRFFFFEKKKQKTFTHFVEHPFQGGNP